MKRYFRPTLAIVLVAMLETLAVMAEVNARIPAGTSVQVRITENLSSETANVGEVFHGSLGAPVIANGRKLFPRGAYVTGEVVNVERSGRLSTPGELHLTLRTIRNGGRTYAVSVGTLVLKGESHTKSNVTKIGGGAALGAMIGAIAGGGKGAGIGAGVGAAAGTGVAAGTGKKPAEVRSETLLAWVVQDDRAVEASQEQAPRQSRGEYESERAEHYVNQPYSHDDDQHADHGGQGPSEFSDQERQVIGDCFVNDRAGLPPGLAKKNHLPPGLERQLQRNGTLPPGLQKRVQPLPESCEAQLPRLPRAAGSFCSIRSGGLWTYSGWREISPISRSTGSPRGLTRVSSRNLWPPLPRRPCCPVPKSPAKTTTSPPLWVHPPHSKQFGTKQLPFNTGV